jgi:hypothetical protein
MIIKIIFARVILAKLWFQSKPPNSFCGPNEGMRRIRCGDMMEDLGREVPVLLPQIKNEVATWEHPFRVRLLRTFFSFFFFF